MRTGAYVWGGVRDGVLRSWSDTCRAALSILAGDASRIAGSFDAPPDVVAAAALLPLRGFFARSFVGYTQNTKNDVPSASVASRTESRKADPNANDMYSVDELSKIRVQQIRNNRVTKRNVHD